jgi:hypothetical protein
MKTERVIMLGVDHKFLKQMADKKGLKDEWGEWGEWGERHAGFTWRFRLWFSRWFYGWHEVLHLGFVQIEYHHF